MGARGNGGTEVDVMTAQEAWDELEDAFPKLDAYVDFDFAHKGRVLIDGTVTLDELRKILELFERLQGIDVAVNKG